MDDKPVTGADGQYGLFASAVIDDTTGNYIIKVANTSDTPRFVTFNFDGLKKKSSLTDVDVLYMRADDKRAENTFDKPDTIKPHKSTMKVSGHKFNTLVQPESFSVYVVSVH